MLRQYFRVLHSQIAGLTGDPESDNYGFGSREDSDNLGDLLFLLLVIKLIDPDRLYQFSMITTMRRYDVKYSIKRILCGQETCFSDLRWYFAFTCAHVCSMGVNFFSGSYARSTLEMTIQRGIGRTR